MTDERRMTTDRFFGGVDGRLDNLRSMLSYVTNEEPTQDELWAWLKANTGAGSESTIQMYLQFIRAIELLERQDDRVFTTSRGEKYAESADAQLLFDALTDHVKGFETVLKAIERGNRTGDAIQDRLRDQYPDYSLPMSIVGRHLEWLEAIGAIEAHDDQYVLTTFGQREARQLASDRWLSSRVGGGRTTQAENESPSETGEETATLDELRERADRDATESVSQSTQVRTVTDYDRSPAIREYVKQRAGGTCEGCGEPAPFASRSGEPYLQAHHIHEVADGGAESPETVIALCPNCHYRVHHGRDGNAYNRELAYRLAEIETCSVDEILSDEA